MEMHQLTCTLVNCTSLFCEMEYFIPQNPVLFLLLFKHVVEIIRKEKGFLN